LVSGDCGVRAVQFRGGEGGTETGSKEEPGQEEEAGREPTGYDGQQLLRGEDCAEKEEKEEGTVIRQQ
jgi:hypothetical protein